MRLGSLFAGIGGFDLAAQRRGWHTAWLAEIEPYCCRELARLFPDSPNLGDVTAVDWTHAQPVDVVCAGFPCQPSSTAGTRLGLSDSRWLWPEVVRCVRALRPRWVVLENVPGLLSVNRGAAFAELLGDLASLGYDAEWDCLRASDLGADHERERLWIVAYPAGQRWAEVVHDYPTRSLVAGQGDSRGAAGNADPCPSENQRVSAVEALCGEPALLASLDGVPDRVAQLSAIGNSIYPDCAEAIFEAIELVAPLPSKEPEHE